MPALSGIIYFKGILINENNRFMFQFMLCCYLIHDQSSDVMVLREISDNVEWKQMMFIFTSINWKEVKYIVLIHPHDSMYQSISTRDLGATLINIDVFLLFVIYCELFIWMLLMHNIRWSMDHLVICCIDIENMGFKEAVIWIFRVCVCVLCAVCVHIL